MSAMEPRPSILNFGMPRAFIPMFLLMLRAILPEAQPVIISGNAPSYAGQDLIFYTTADYFSATEKEMGRGTVTSSGDFHIEIPALNTLQVYASLGIYKALLWIEPRQEYHVILPEKVDKSPQDVLNPYFEPVEVQLAIDNFREDELNTLIMMFKDAYNPYYNKHVNDLYAGTQPERIEADIEQIEKSFRKYSNPFFKEYRYYSYGQLKLLASLQKVSGIEQEYFNGKPVLYDNQAYMDLFNQVYDRYFTFLGRSETGKKIYNDINQYQSYSSLLQTLSENSHITGDTLLEMVILKEVYDEFYGMEFSRKGLLCILDSLILTSSVARNKEIGMIIRHKITRLQEGYDPPGFELIDADSNRVSLKDFTGKYVYLCFCTSSSYTCLSEFKLLRGIYQRHYPKLVIIIISTDPYNSTFDQFKDKNNYPWIFLYYGHQPGVIKDYDVRAFPTYFLIGPDGKLIFSPAPSPSENFETKLFEVMRARGDLN
jgi:peroxiredoxin